MTQWNATKTKVQLRLAVQRLRMLQEKKSAQAKSARRDIATLVERGRLESAFIKVENIINEDIYVELLELLELYSELLIARFTFLDLGGKEPDPGIREAVCCLIYAAPRTDLKELHILREMLMHKFGREFSLAVMENRDNCVGDRVMRKLAASTPSPALVEGYVQEIAKGYGIDYTPTPKHEEGDNPTEEGDQPNVEQKKVASSSEKKPAELQSEEEIKSKLDANATASKLPTVPSTTVATVESKASSPQPPPYMPPTKPLKSAFKKVDPPTSSVGLGESGSQPPFPEDDFMSLTQRLAALKKR